LLVDLVGNGGRVWGTPYLLVEENWRERVSPRRDVRLCRKSPAARRGVMYHVMLTSVRCGEGL